MHFVGLQMLTSDAAINTEALLYTRERRGSVGIWLNVPVAQQVGVGRQSQQDVWQLDQLAKAIHKG